MKLKSQLRFHLRWLALAAAGVALGLGIGALVTPVPAPVGTAFDAVPFYRLPFGPDDAGAPRPFWPSRMQAASAGFADGAALPSSATCAACHRREFDEWAGSLHAVAGNERVYEATEDANAEVGRNGAEQVRFCEGCHSPGTLLTGRANRFASVMPHEAELEGVSCISCHTAIHADPETGNGALTLAFDRAEIEARGPQGAALLADPRAHLAAFGAPDTTALLKTGDFCGACHNETLDSSMSLVPDPGVAVQATHAEWRESWYADNGITCQTCHMAPDPAAQVMRIRDGDLRAPATVSHRFIGSNWLLTDTALGDSLMILRGGFLPGVDAALGNMTAGAQLEQTRAFLRTAAGLELRESRLDAAGLHLHIAVQNLGAGHNLPTGVGDQKYMELEVVLRDAAGREIFRSGGDEQGPEGSAAVRWMEEFVDSRGRVIPDHITFRTAAVRWTRHGIPPRGEEVVPYDIALPDDTAGPFTLEVRLLYRLARPELILSNLHMRVDVPFFALAELTATIAGDGA
ncbi:MAG: hypothetical protein H3C51_03120 [Rubellimicrobium sp.]|nr:hypothetical protein [Rubellimicrobium sp.]